MMGNSSVRSVPKWKQGRADIESMHKKDKTKGIKSKYKMLNVKKEKTLPRWNEYIKKFLEI